MLFHLLYPLHTIYSVFNVFRYITFRTIYAAITALLICFVLGPWIIKKLSTTGAINSVREDVPTTHLTKEGVPTMGGILILTALVIPTLLWADLTSTSVWLVLVATLLFGSIGFADDMLKLRRGRGKGLKARYKIALQAGVALVVSGILVGALKFDTRVYFPFFKGFTPDLGGSMSLSSFLLFWEHPILSILRTGWTALPSALFSYRLGHSCFSAIWRVTPDLPNTFRLLM